MKRTEYALDALHFCFVVKQVLPDGTTRFSLTSHAPFREDQTTFPFDSETDAAQYFLDMLRSEGALASEQDVATAKAILRGEQPLFLYEEKQPDGTLLLSFHDQLPPEQSKIVSFACRSPQYLAGFLFRRLRESERVRASEETIRQAQALLDNEEFSNRALLE